MNKEITLENIISGIDGKYGNLKDILEKLEPIILNELRESNKKEEKILKRFNHMKIVAFIAKELIFLLKGNGYKFSNDTINAIIIGAFIHDIKKFNIQNGDHSILGADFIKNNERISNLIYPYAETVSEIVKYHKEGYYKKKKDTQIINKKNLDRLIEIRIVQDADKISSIYKENKNIQQEIKNIMQGKSLNFKESIEFLKNNASNVLHENNIMYVDTNNSMVYYDNK